MTNRFYNYTTSVVAGKPVRSAKFNDEMQGIDAGFVALQAELDALAPAAAASAAAAAASAVAAAASATAASGSATSASASAVAAAASAALLSPITDAMPAYTVVARNAGTTGAAAAYALNQSRFAGLAAAIGGTATLTIGTGGTYSTLNDLISHACAMGYFSVTISCLGGTVTDTSGVVFPPGMSFNFLNSSSTTFRATSGAGKPAYHIPRGSVVTIASGGGLLRFDSNNASGASAGSSVWRVDGAFIQAAAATTTVELDAINSGGVVRILEGYGGIMSSDERFSIDETYSTSGCVFYGGIIDCSFVTSGAPKAMSLYGVNTARPINIHDPFSATNRAPTYYVYGGNCNFTVETGTCYEQILYFGPGAVGAVYTTSTTTLTADAAMNTQGVISALSADIKITGISINITSAGASCTRCVNAANSDVLAQGCTFTGAGADHALYGAAGSTLKGSGNTYTTLTASNLTGTWAVGGQYLNA